MQGHHVVRATLALPLAACSLVAAGCGRGPHSPAVASLGASGATTTANATGGLPAPNGPFGGGSGGSATLSLKPADAAKFAACMRTHGVPDFPDPNSRGGITIDRSSRIDPGSPAFNRADQHCKRLLPNGGQPSPQEEARMRAGALGFSACMRKHGVTNFPDPTFSDGDARIKIAGGPGSNLDPRSPAFQAAQKACGGKLPGDVGGATANGK
jgi:hypothetical protein